MSTQKKLLIAFIVLLFTHASNAQVLCINCYRQNPPVSTNITNLVINGGFETSGPQNLGYVCPNSSYYNTDIDSWTCTGGGPLTYAMLVDSGWWFVAEGLKSFYMGNQFCSICNPTIFDTVCKVRQGCTVTGIPAGYPVSNGSDFGLQNGVSISQTVNGLVPGNVYVVEFWSGGEGDLTQWAEDGVFALDIGFGNVFLTCPKTAKNVGVGMRYIIQFAATATSHTIKFTNWGHSCGNCTEVILDDVRLYPINQLSSIIPACALGTGMSDNNIDLKVTLDDSRQLQIHTTSGKKLYISIYNMLSEKITGKYFSNDTEIDLKLIQRGIYLYQITDGAKTVRMEKVVLM